MDTTPACSRCHQPFKYGSVEIQSQVTGLTMELCIRCAARQFRMSEAQIRKLMDANGGGGTEMTVAGTTTIEVDVKDLQ